MKQKDNYIAKHIRESISAIDSRTPAIVFESRARGDARNESDWDILILTNHFVSTDNAVK
jgi:predicted nucleotidyltransferase